MFSLPTSFSSNKVTSTQIVCRLVWTERTLLTRVVGNGASCFRTSTGQHAFEGSWNTESLPSNGSREAASTAGVGPGLQWPEPHGERGEGSDRCLWCSLWEAAAASAVGNCTEWWVHTEMQKQVWKCGDLGLRSSSTRNHMDREVKALIAASEQWCIQKICEQHPRCLMNIHHCLAHFSKFLMSSAFCWFCWFCTTEHPSLMVESVCIICQPGFNSWDSQHTNFLSSQQVEELGQFGIQNDTETTFGKFHLFWHRRWFSSDCSRIAFAACPDPANFSLRLVVKQKTSLLKVLYSCFFWKRRKVNNSETTYSANGEIQVWKINIMPAFVTRWPEWEELANPGNITFETTLACMAGPDEDNSKHLLFMCMNAFILAARFFNQRQKDSEKVFAIFAKFWFQPRTQDLLTWRTCRHVFLSRIVALLLVGICFVPETSYTITGAELTTNYESLRIFICVWKCIPWHALFCIESTSMWLLLNVQTRNAFLLLKRTNACLTHANLSAM